MPEQDFKKQEAEYWDGKKDQEASDIEKKAHEMNMRIFEKLGFYEETGKAALQIPIEKDGVVLDLGCGTGEVTKFLNGRFVVGSDISIKELRKAKGSGKDFVLGDAESIPFKDCVFDVIIATNLLHHLPCPEKCLDECYRVLKKGGKLLTLDTNLHSPMGFLIRSVATAIGFHDKEVLDYAQFAFSPLERQFSKNAYGKLFRNSDFSNFNIRAHRFQTATYYATMFFPKLAKLFFWRPLVYWINRTERRLCKVPLISWFCYFWKCEARK